MIRVMQKLVPHMVPGLMSRETVPLPFMFTVKRNGSEPVAENKAVQIDLHKISLSRQ